MSGKKDSGKKKNNKERRNTGDHYKHTQLQTVLHSVSGEANDDYLAMFQSLVDQIPRDSNGFLTYFINNSMIPSNYANRTPENREKILKSAKIDISNLEGYPTFQFHKPIWENLPHEPESYYLAYRAYMLSPARSLQEALDTLPPGFTPYTLKEAYILFFWRERAKAYDLYMPVAASRLRDQRLLQLEDNHYRLSEKLLITLTEEIQNRAKEQQNRPWQGLTSADLIKSLVTAAELQRTSLGLPAKGPKTNDQGYIPPINSGIDRSIREASINYTGELPHNTSQASAVRQKIDKLIANDPEVAESLQKAAMDAIMKSREKS